MSARANLIQIRSKTDTVLMSEVEIHPEKAIENLIFETQNLLPEIYKLKTQFATYNQNEVIDVIGLDNENNIVIIEIKDEMVDESALSQGIRYALWVEAHPDAIKNIWHERNKTPDFDWEKDVSIRVVIVGPSFEALVPKLATKMGYNFDLIEIKKFTDGNLDYIFLNTLKTPEREKSRAINPIQGYDEAIYMRNFNPSSAQEFWKLANKLEDYIKNKKWNLTRANNKSYISFKYGFPIVFGLQFVGSKSFCFFFKVSKDIAEATEIKGYNIYRYEDQWKQAMHKVENANINLSLFEPLFEAAYKNIVGR